MNVKYSLTRPSAFLSALRFGAVAVAPALFLVLNTGSARAQEPAAPIVAVLRNADTIEPTAALLDLRSAPARQAVEMLAAGALDPSLMDKDIAGFLTLTLTNQTVSSLRKTIYLASQSPLAMDHYHAVYPASSGRPVAIWTKSENRDFEWRRGMAFGSATSPGKVPRRVRGVLVMSDGSAFAILETAAPLSSHASNDVRVIAFAASATGLQNGAAPSGVSGTPDLVVAGIDSSGVTLTEADGSRILVPFGGDPARS